jgi:hypothetical protein
MIAHTPARTFLASRIRVLRAHVATGMADFTAAARSSSAASLSSLSSSRSFITANYRQFVPSVKEKITW